MITLVLGGTRSGKSAVAEELAARAGAPVVYVATGSAAVDDADMAARIARHRDRRPPTWSTVEAGAALPAALADHPTGTVLVDALGTWVAAHPDLDPDVDALVTALHAREGDTVLVSDEVGLGVHPSTDVGRRFRDVLGEVNTTVAAVADDVVFVIAGRVLPSRDRDDPTDRVPIAPWVPGTPLSGASRTHAPSRTQGPPPPTRRAGASNS